MGVSEDSFDELISEEDFLEIESVEVSDLSLLEWADVFEVPEERFPRKLSLLQSLSRLDLSEMEITELPDAIGDLTNLRELILSENLLETLPSSLGCLKKLVLLDLSSNLLKKLPASLSQLKKLTSLDISSNPAVESLFPVISRLEGLQELFLEGCNIESFNLDTSRIKSLKCLHLNSARFDSWQFLANTYFRDNLEELSISDIQIDCLPSEILNLRKLRVLDLGGCHLKVLPDNIDLLNNLESMNLGVNKLSFLPKSFSNLRRLKELSLGNNTELVFPEFLRELTGLLDLDLSDMPLKSLDFLSSLVNLKRLILFGCSVKRLPEVFFIDGGR